jgi:SAM-dependent methyltransferase
MLDYDREAATYDATRGGEARAVAAATAIESLLPPGAATLADLACGTGIVTTRLRAPYARPAGRERRVIGIDLSSGMAAVAAARLPGRIVVGDATRLPLADGSLDAVVMIWLLHLMDETASATVLGEATRVLRPGGALLTTVDKNDAEFTVGSDLADVITPVRAAHAPPNRDGLARLTGFAVRLGLTPTARTTFVGEGQGRSPRQWCAALRAGRFAWARSADVHTPLCERLEALPGQERPRPDPVYRLVRFTRKAPGQGR